jgi:hypothetical protein
MAFRRLNGFSDVIMRLVDVPHRPLLQALRKAIVLFLRDIAVGFVDQFKSAMSAARRVELGVNRRVIVQILTVVNPSLLDVANGVVDFTDRFPFLFPQGIVVRGFEVGSCEPQIGKGVQISRMFVLCETAQSAQRQENC